VDVAGTVLGITGALAGVALGAWFSSRNERWRVREAYRREDHQARVRACINFLTEFRRVRVFLLTSQIDVVLQPGASPDSEVAFVRGAPAITDAMQSVVAELRLLEGGETPIYQAAAAVQAAARQMFLARSRQPEGPLPVSVVEAAREAERAFVRVAHQELELR
jgi:hypothetical protein